MSSVRNVVGKPDVFTQGVTEEIQYVFHFDDMLAGIGTPTTPLNTYLYLLSDGSDQASTNLSGVADLTDFAFTTPKVVNLTRDVVYRLVAEVTVGTQKFSLYKDIKGEL